MDCKEAEELLPSYALNTLSPEEAAQVDAHLDTCHWCGALLREHVQVASALAQAAERLEPPEKLKKSTMRAAEKLAAHHQSSGRRPLPLARLVLGAVATIVVLLLAAVVSIGLRMSDQIDDLQEDNSALATQLSELAPMSHQIDDLQEENSALAAQLSQLAKEDEKLVDMFEEQRSVSYIMAAPDKQVMSLQGDRRVSKAQGMLMISAQGSTGILMAKGLEPSTVDKAYYVWLRKNGQRVAVGQLYVDETGWGVLSLWPDQPITLFQQVRVTEQPAQGTADPDRSPVLWGTIGP